MIRLSHVKCVSRRFEGDRTVVVVRDTEELDIMLTSCLTDIEISQWLKVYYTSGTMKVYLIFSF